MLFNNGNVVLFHSSLTDHESRTCCSKSTAGWYVVLLSTGSVMQQFYGRITSGFITAGDMFNNLNLYLFFRRIAQDGMGFNEISRLRCRWQVDVGDFILVSNICHQHRCSQISLTTWLCNLHVFTSESFCNFFAIWNLVICKPLQ